jgi:hypothetical protein
MIVAELILQFSALHFSKTAEKKLKKKEIKGKTAFQ